MAFKDYSTTPANNTTLGDGTYVGPNMLRNKVRPAIQQLMADGRDVYDELTAMIDTIPQGEPGINGLNGGVGSSAGFAALFATAAGMTIEPGVMRIKTDGHTVHGVGSAEYIYSTAVNSAYVTANPQTSFLAAINVPDASARGFRLDPTQRVTFDMFGAIPGDYTTGVGTDCYAAWQAMKAWVTANPRNKSVGYQAAGPEIYFPGNQYYFSDTLILDVTIRMRGMGGGHSGGEPTWLTWPANKAGIIPRDVVTTANGSIIEGFCLQGNGGTLSGVLATDLLKSGIRLLSRCIIRDVYVRNFAGAGICISAAIGGGGGDFTGNANNWRLDNIRLEDCSTGGLYVSGGDANAGLATLVDATRCGRFGVYDASFLGNTYIACHTDANGYPSSTGLTQTSLTSFGGNRYYLVDGVSHATAIATTPGTNTAVWRFLEVGGVTGNYVDWTTPGASTFVSGGAYGGTSNFCAYLGCYYETGQAPPQIGAGALIIGGFMGNGVSGSAPQLHATADGLTQQKAFKQTIALTGGTAFNRFGGVATGNKQPLLSWNSTLATPSNTAAEGRLEHDVATGDLEWRAYSDVVRPLSLTGNLTAETFGGRSQAESDLIVRVTNLAVGAPGMGGGVQDRGSAPPTTGFHGRGDLRWNDGSVTGIATVGHWICSVAGTPGTWVAK